MYEILLKEATQQGLDIYEEKMKPRIKGLYADNVIWINELITTSNEKACVLAEELGHYHTTVGDILNQQSILDRKQEKVARAWAYKKLVPFTKIIDAYKEGITNKYEFAEYLGVTESFLLEAINRYKEEHGLFAKIDQYTIFFEPFAVMEMFDDRTW